MKVSTEWLKQYIDQDLSVEALAERLTMVGLEVEQIIPASAGYSGVVVGEIQKVEKHPNADKLKLCTVDFGGESVPIVCGAPNVAEGQRVPVARVGAVLGEHRIDTVTLRGVESFGMICSERELGLSDNHDGILVLDDDGPAVGEAFLPSLDSGDATLEINVTPNRPDCLSHLGVAREIGVILGKPLIRPYDTVVESDEKTDDGIAVVIEDPVACPRYTARIVRDVTIGPSPEWLKKRLESVGVRPINNVVDITNYVLMETGQPLHAFDYDLVRGQKIIVRKASKGETFVTLDGNEHKLEAEDLLICDGERPVALAGVMGGLNSEVSENTKHILLESAYFDPPTVRRTAKRLGLSTEASHRFERGADPNGTVYAANRAAGLFQELAGGRVAQGVVDAHPKPVSPWKVLLRLSRIEHVLGEAVPKVDVIGILERLELSVSGDEPLQVEIPTFRPDLTREIDLIEEVVRHHGFDKIAPRFENTITLMDSKNAWQAFTDGLKDTLVGLGFQETMTNTLVSESHAKKSAEHEVLELQNPLSPDTTFLRTSLIPSLLDSVCWNVNRSASDLRLFEVGKVFWKRKGQVLPEESWMVCAALTGRVHDRAHWGSRDEAVGFYHLKGAVESLASQYHLELSFKNVSGVFYLKDTAFSIRCGKTEIGRLGKLASEIKTERDLSQDVFLFELNIARLSECIPDKTRYTPISKFPSIKRDLALVVDDDVPAGELGASIAEQGAPMLSSVSLFDMYRGDQVPEGKKSLAFSLEFSSQSRTLTDEEIEPVLRKIIEGVERTYSARLRS